MKTLWSKWKRRAAIVMVCGIIFGEIAGLPILNLSAAGQEAMPGAEIATEQENLAGTETESVKETESVPETETEVAVKRKNAVLMAVDDVVDRTNDADEVGITISDFTVWNASNKQLNCSGPATVDGVSLYDASKNAYYDVAKVRYRMDVSVIKAWANRELKSGDYLELNIPEGFSGTDGGEMRDGSGTLIATYAITGSKLKITFADAVTGTNRNDNIKGGMYVELTFDADARKGKDKTAELVPARGIALPIGLKLPDEPDTIDGISKTGKLNITTNEITWEIKVGTADLSKGTSLDGVVLTEQLPKELELTSVTAKNAKNQNVTVTKGADNVTLTLSGAEAVAPVTVTVVTNIKEDVLTDAINKKKESLLLANNVSMDSSDDSLKFGDNKSASDSVSVNLSPKVEKLGEQIDSNTIRWTIHVNHTNPVRVYRGYVVDALATGLTYKKGSVTCSAGSVTEVDTQPETDSNSAWPLHNLWVKKEASGSQTLYFYMKEDTQDSYTITFDTTVADGFMADSAGTEEPEIHNEATVHAQFPTGNGPIPVEYGIPGIDMTFNTAKINKEVSASGKKPRGQLTWTLYPSVRALSYTTAEITDTINTNQRYLEDTLKIYEKTGDTWTECADALKTAGVFGWSDTDKKLTLVYTKPAASSGHSDKLSDYKIVYETDALTFLQENGREDTYKNTAILEVKQDGKTLYKSEGSASAKLKNDWAKKTTKFEYLDNGTPCYHYTITVNSNGIQNLENVIVSDCIRDAITVKDGGTDISEDWVLDTAKTKVLVGGAESAAAQMAYTDGDRAVEIKFPSLSATAVIELYAKYAGDISKLTTGDYANQVIYSNNTAKVKSDEVEASDGTAISVANDKANIKMDNTLVQKKCIKTENSGGTKLTWQVIINPNSGKMGTISIQDTIPKSHKYIEDTVKLYEADYTNGTLEKKGSGTSLASPMVAFDVGKTNRTMKLEIEAGNATRILEYQTALVDSSTKKVTNSIQVKEGATNYGTGEGEKDLSGGDWGSLTSAGTLILQKQDASVGADMPLQGAEFTIYADEEGKKPVDVGETTGEKGMVTFYGLNVSGTGVEQTYYYKETKTPDGYEKDETIYPVIVEKSAERTYEVKNVRKTENSKISKVTLRKKFIYRDAAGKEKEAAGRQAAFELKFYPYGEGNAKGGKTVSLTGSDGAYAYDADGTAGIEIKNHADTGEIVIEGLPWGYYGIKETQSADGFALDSQEYYFEIQQNANMDVVYKFGSNGTKDDAVLTNTAIQFQTAKYEEGTTNLISGIHLEICEKKADGTRGDVVTDALNDNSAYEWDTGNTVKAIYNLPAGTYFLHENAEKSANQGYAVAEKDTEFTVLPNGTIKGAADNTVKIYNKAITLSVAKVDQFDDPVAGAEIRMEGISDGSYNKSSTTTDTVGGNIITFDGLVRNGEYTLTEVKLPDAEHLAFAPVTVKVSADGNSFVFTQTGADGEQTQTLDADGTLHLVDRKLFVPITIQKADDMEEEMLLAEAEFELYGQKFESEESEWLKFCEIKTDTEGRWEMSGLDAGVKNPFDITKNLSLGLKPGRYYIKETKAPAGYKALPADTRMRFEITSEGIIQLENDAKFITVSGTDFTISDLPLTLRIQSLEFDNGYDEGLGDEDLNGKGAVYEVSGNFIGGSRTITLAGTEDGAFAQENELKGILIPGELYAITEITAPEGYIAPEPVYVKIDEHGETVLCGMDGNGTGDSGSYAKAENPDSLMDGVANGYNGLVKIYHGKTKAQLIKYTSWNGAAKKEETDKAAYQKLSGINFTLTGMLSGGRTSAEYVTDAEGKIVFAGDLVDGEVYTLRETTPTGYRESGDVIFTYDSALGITLDVGAPANAAAGVQDGIPSIEIVNETAQNTSLQFLVYDCTDGLGLSGAEFKLTCTPADGGLKTETVLTTDKAGEVYPYVTAGESHEKVTVEGEAFVADLQPGDYKLVQTTAPHGYSLSAESITITFKVDENTKNETIVINETNVKNRAYGLTATDFGPKVVSKGICNKRVDGTVVIEKQDRDDHTPLNDVGFAIYRYKEADNIFELLKNLVTGKAYAVAEKEWTEAETDTGSLKITGLEWGKYYIVETKPLEGYAIDETKYDFEIGKNTPTQMLEWSPGVLINAKIQLILPPTNAETDQADVAGHKMRIYGSFQNTDDTYIEWEETDQPYIISGMLIPGETYTLEEVTTLSGYNSAVSYQFKYNGIGKIDPVSVDSAVDIVVGADGTVKLVRAVEPLKIRIRKTDEDGKLLSGAALSLYVQDEKGERTLVAETTTDGSAWELTGDKYNQLLAGATCILTEKSAPEGYEIAEDVTFTVAEGTTWQEYTMIDKRIQKKPTETETDKVSGTGNGTDINPGTGTGSGENPGTGTEGNKTKTEKETETETETGKDSGKKKNNAPAGDEQNGGGTAASVEATGADALRTAALPKTGKEERAGFYAVGGMLVAAGVLLLLFGRRKKKKFE